MAYSAKAMDCPDEGSPEYQKLSAFSKEVEIILQTVLDEEFEAALSLMGPPSDSFDMAVNFPNDKMVAGKFANQKIALIQTESGANVSHGMQDAICVFPNAKYIISVGICYSFDKTKMIGDVLVSEAIADFIPQYTDGKIINLGETMRVEEKLQKLFRKRSNLDEDFEVSNSGRVSRVYASTFLSYPALMDSKEGRDKIEAAVPTAVGGEKEGGTLLGFQKRGKVDGVILVKGIVDYGEGGRLTNEEWYYTAALAALHYTQSKLCNYRPSQQGIANS